MKSTSTHVYCAVAITTVIGQFLALGANNSLLAVVFSELTLVAVGFCLLIEPRSAMDRQYSAAVAPFLIFLISIIWILVPVFFPIAGADHLVPDAVLPELIKLGSLAALVMLGAQIGKTPRGLRLGVFWLLCAGLAYLLLSLWLWRDNPAQVWGQAKGRHLTRFTATLLNANAAACICATVALLGLAQLHASLAKPAISRTFEDWAEAGVAGLAVLLGIFTIFLTASRAGGVALTALALLQALAAGSWKNRARRLLAVAALGGVAIAASLIVGHALTLDRPFTHEDSQVRLDGYRIYWGLIQEQPLFGYGLGSFRQLHQSHIGPGEADLIWDLGAAHQPIVQAALEGGAPFALALVAAVCWLLTAVLRKLFSGARGQELALGVTLSAILILSVAQVDIALNVPAVASLAMLLLGLAWGWSSGASLAKTLASPGSRTVLPAAIAT